MSKYKVSEEEMAALGPLRVLLGEWTGDKGADRAPSSSDRKAVANSSYKEHMRFEPTGRVDNHEQILYGLRYATTAWRLGEPNPFHEELGYWMWDAKESQVIRCFLVPRGVSVIAGGTVKADANTIKLAAKLGSQTYGICSNLFLDREFQTVAYDVELKILNQNSIQYEETTELKIIGQNTTFKHIDKNILTRLV
ncbi:MAG: heme-binding beta-barrel domain-containing protein [Proteobacteria bacterium]|nr:heme-binding beta-barrel domain-containing protein [Pseudomonadota bacterium]